MDTDAYNEIDDQFAIAYLLVCEEKLNTKAMVGVFVLPRYHKTSSIFDKDEERNYYLQTDRS